MSGELYNHQVFKKVMYEEVTAIQAQVEQMQNSLTQLLNGVMNMLDEYDDMRARTNEKLETLLANLSKMATTHTENMQTFLNKTNNAIGKIEEKIQEAQAIHNAINKTQTEMKSMLQYIQQTQVSIQNTQTSIQNTQKKIEKTLEYIMFFGGGVGAVIVLLLLYMMK